MNVEAQTTIVECHVEDGVVVIDKVDIDCLYEVGK